MQQCLKCLDDETLFFSRLWGTVQMCTWIKKEGGRKYIGTKSTMWKHGRFTFSVLSNGGQVIKIQIQVLLRLNQRHLPQTADHGSHCSSHSCSWPPNTLWRGFFNQYQVDCLCLCSSRTKRRTHTAIGDPCNPKHMRFSHLLRKDVLCSKRCVTCRMWINYQNKTRP